MLKMIRKIALAIAVLLAVYSLSGATTYYIRMSTDTSPNHPGNNANNGTSWQTPWADITHLNDGTFHGGDTVFFGSGRWRPKINRGIIPVSGNHSDMTVYACSSFAATNGQGQYHFAQIWNSDSLTNWTNVGGNVWRCYHNFDGLVYNMSQGDSLLWFRTSRSQLTHEGLFYQTPNFDTFYVWCWRNENPNSCDMEGSESSSGGPWWKGFDFLEPGADYVKIYGLAIQHSGDCGIRIENSAECDSVIIERCKITHNVNGDLGGGGTNCGNITFASCGGGERRHDWCMVRACSLSWGAMFYGVDNGGTGIETYTADHFLADSNVFYGFFSAGAIMQKHTNSGVTGGSRYNVYRYNTLDIHPIWNPVEGASWPCALGIGFINYPLDDSVYGNIIYGGSDLSHPGIGSALRLQGTVNGTAGGQVYFYNNTIYNCNQGSSHGGHEQIARGDTDIVTKYNIFMNCRTYHNLTATYWRPGMSYDDNMYYGPYTDFSIGGSHYNWSQWQALTGYGGHHFDSLSVMGVNPNFNNPVNGDFSRPMAPQEINVVYGGRTWTRYGAMQSNDPPPPPPPLAISNVRTTNVTYSSVTINWDTNIPASSQVEYGTTPSYGSSTALDPALVTVHAQNISGLSQSTTYHYRVRSRDGNNNEVVSGDYTFTTATRDVTPPTITSIQSTDLTDNSAIIHWQTNEAATSRINYGLTNSYGQSSNLDNNLVLSHAVAIAGLLSDTLYHFRVRSSDSSGNEAVSSDYTFRTDTTWNMAVISLNVPDSVSGTYSGYTTVPINDGVVNPRGGINTTWASDQSDSSPHWVEMSFDTPKIVRRARLQWAWNSYSSDWMCSQRYIIQYWDNSINSFINAAVVNNSSIDSITTTDFPPVTTTRIRCWQPANMGPPSYPSIIWLTELEFYGSNAQQDTMAPAAIQDLNALPADGHGNTRLFWIAPGDDGSSGWATSYAIRYSQDPIDETNWANAMLVTNPPFPVNGGNAQEFTAGGLSAGETYFWAIKTYDEVGNASGISNIPEAYASGIAPPQPGPSSVDDSGGMVTLSSYPVESYYSLFYEFELDVSEAFDNSRTEPAFLAGSLASATFDDIQENTDYFWRCRAIASARADSSDWSQIEHLNLSGGAEAVLADQNCLYPAEGDVVSSSQPAFAVLRPREANEIYFQVDDNSQFDSPIISGPVSAVDSLIVWRPNEPLEHAGAYFWRASLDNQAWTSPLSFTAVLDIHAFPNPFRAGDGNSEVTFCNLPQDASLTIATISGNIVKTVDRVGPGSQWAWDLRNDDGQSITSGIYLYKVSYNRGSSSGKVMVIK
jgi:hypothetical protein